MTASSVFLFLFLVLLLTSTESCFLFERRAENFRELVLIKWPPAPGFLTNFEAKLVRTKRQKAGRQTNTIFIIDDWFFHPVKIFGDASRQTCALILTVCHMCYSIKISTQQSSRKRIGDSRVRCGGIWILTTRIGYSGPPPPPMEKYVTKKTNSSSSSSD